MLTALTFCFINYVTFESFSAISMKLVDTLQTFELKTFFLFTLNTTITIMV